MQANLKAHGNSLLRKTIIIFFLPIIVMVWMSGWTLIQIGSTGNPTEIKQKTTYAPPEFEAHKKSEMPSKRRFEVNQ